MKNHYEKLQDIIDNYINGNITDAKGEIKKLTKRELMTLIRMWSYHHGYEEAISIIEKLV